MEKVLVRYKYVCCIAKADAMILHTTKACRCGNPLPGYLLVFKRPCETRHP